jgi:hypothetical protein
MVKIETQGFNLFIVDRLTLAAKSRESPSYLLGGIFAVTGWGVNIL